jgi:hypothetical protein
MALTAEERLHTLAATHPDARPMFQELMDYATAQGWHPYISSARRTCREQQGCALSKAKRSWHPLGRAIDVELQIEAPDDDPAKYYRELGEWWESQGGTWGGRWTDLYPIAPGVPGASGDVMHYQWTPAPMTERVPDALWPDGASCEELDRLAANYVRGRGTTTPPKSAGAFAVALFVAPVLAIGAFFMMRRRHAAG